MNEDGLTNEAIKTLQCAKEDSLTSEEWQKYSFNLREQVLRQLEEISKYCKEQRKQKRPANSLKTNWARVEISALSAMLNGLKDTEIELLKLRMEGLERAAGIEK